MSPRSDSVAQHLQETLSHSASVFLLDLFHNMLCQQFQHGVTIYQAMVELELLLNPTTFTVTTLAQHCDKSRSTVQRAVDKLLDAGIVRLGRGDENMRRRPIVVTEAGQRRAADLKAAITAWRVGFGVRIMSDTVSGLKLIPHSDTTLELFLLEIVPWLQKAARRHLSADGQKKLSDLIDAG